MSGNEPEEKRRGSAAIVGLGAVLIISAGVGLGWGLDQAVRGDKGQGVSSPVPTTAGQVSLDPPSAPDSTVDSPIVEPTVAADPEATNSSVPGSPGITEAPAADASNPVVTDSAAVPEPTDSGESVTVESVVDPAAETTVVPAESPTESTVALTEPGPPDTGVVDAPATDVPATEPPIPTTAVADDRLPNAFAFVEAGKLTIRGVFVDQAAMNAAVSQLTPLGVNGVSIEASIDPNASGSPGIPVIVADAAVFESGSAVLGEGGQPLLDQFIEVMRATPAARLVIKGHTDAGGSDAYNFALSQQRVARVFDYFTKAEIDPSRLELDPRGETEPIADNATPEGRARNRRVELIFVA